MGFISLMLRWLPEFLGCPELPDPEFVDKRRTRGFFILPAHALRQVVMPTALIPTDADTSTRHIVTLCRTGEQFPMTNFTSKGSYFANTIFLEATNVPAVSRYT